MNDSTALAELTDPLEKLAVKYPGQEHSGFDRALDVLRTISRKEGIPIAIIGGMAAIKHGYERYTHDIDVVIGQKHLDPIVRVSPKYSLKVLWQDPHGWHKFQYEGVRIEVIPEGGKPGKNAPTTIPGAEQLGVQQGAEYASLPGWVETKLSSNRQLDRADVVQVLKKTEPAAIARVREHIAGVHPVYLRLLEELITAAEGEMEQEKERGGPR